MTTNAPESRKTHITRIFGTNKAGDRLEDMWVDVERMDIVKSAHQVPPDLQWQGLQRTFRWCDDPNADDYSADGTPSRKLEILKVCDVENEDDPNDPQEWVPVKVVKGIKARNESGMDYNGGGAMDRFIASVTADELQSARDITVRRIVHYDTNQDDTIQAAADANSELREYVVQASDYEKDQETKDKDQYVEHEIIKSLKSKGNTTFVNGQGSQTRLLNQYLIDESEDATQKIVGLNGYNPPYRLDPFQNIVNVKLRTLYLIVAVSGGNTSFSSGPYGDAPDVPAPTVSSIPKKKTGIKLLDVTSPSNLNTSSDGPSRCFAYQVPGNPQDAWVAGSSPSHPPVTFATTDGACPWPGGGDPPEGLAVAPVNFFRSISVGKIWLYKIPAGDGIVTVDVEGIVAASDSGVDADTFNEIIKSGSGVVQARVYSRVKTKITKITDLLSLGGDDTSLKPTEDDQCILTVTNSTQGQFIINVKLDKKKANAQIDNYGKTFQPYKVTLDHGDAADVVPPQPPVRLPS